MRRWSEDETMKFVKLYSENDCLWDSTKLSYRNAQLRNIALNNIVDAMDIDGFSVAEARQKIKSLRNTYSQELVKIEKSFDSGIDDEVYVPSLRWFNVMDEFMRRIKEKRCIENNMETKPMMPRRRPFKSSDSLKNYSAIKKYGILSQPGDGSEAFGRHVASKLRNLTKIQRLAAEKIINETLFYGELEKLTLPFATQFGLTIENAYIQPDIHLEIQ